jgi:hypothetical protein
MAERLILLKLEADASSLVSNIETSKKAIQNLSSETTRQSAQIATGAQKATFGFGRFGQQITKIPRTNILPLLNSQLISVTSSVTGTTAATQGLQRGMMVLQGTAGSLLGPIGLLIGILGGLATAFILLRTKTEHNTSAFKEWLKEYKEFTKEISLQDKQRKHQIELEERLIRLQKLQAEMNERALTQSKALIFFKKIVEKATFGVAISVEDEIKAVEKEIALYKLYETEMKNKISNDNQNLENIKETLPWLERLNKELLKALPEITKESWAKIEARPELKLPTLESILGGMPGERAMSPEEKRALEEYLKWYEELETQQARQKESLESLKNVTINYAWQMSDAWVDMMMGVEVNWDQMIKSMVANLIKSGIQNLILGLFTGGGVGGIFGFLGFQHGTPYVPKTGAYLLHKGEAVVPAYRNVSYVRNYNQGGNTTNYYMLNLDPEKLTRRSIVPLIEKMAVNRQTRLVAG